MKKHLIYSKKKSVAVAAYREALQYVNLSDERFYEELSRIKKKYRAIIFGYKTEEESNEKCD